MKKLVRNLTGSFVALLLLAGMFSCSNGDDLDTDDPFVEANIINPANKGGGATGGNTKSATGENTKSVIIELPQNFYEGENHGLSFRQKIADLGIEFSPAVGETYTIYMKGTANDYTHLSNMCIGFETDYDWQNCAMEGRKDFTGLENGVSVDVRFNGTADGDWYFWFYDGGTDATAEPVTLTLSDFSVTKK